MTGTVAVVGTGLIGRAWSMIFARAGWSVRLWDPMEGVAGAAVGLCAEGLRDMATHGLCDDPAAASRIVAADTLEDCLDGAGFIQENGPEVLDGVGAWTRARAAGFLTRTVQRRTDTGLAVRIVRLSTWTARATSPSWAGRLRARCLGPIRCL